MAEEQQRPSVAIEGLKIEEKGSKGLSRPFGKKFWAYFKQSNPIINTWRYYMRL